MTIQKLRIAIVGAGPAGLYAAGHLLEERDIDVEIDILERLPTPWGLVRAAVAPDHPDKKRVADRLFDFHLQHPKVRFLGNIEVGTDVRHAELSQWYDAVIYSIGASSDTRMGIPGEELPGCRAAREFVSWYNGHPDFSDLQFDLSCERAIVVGNGNVALDVARILTTSVSELEKTDIADYALEALRTSRIKEVVLLGRRGHFQGAFHNPELEELEHLDGVDILIDGEDLPSDNEVVLDGADWETRRKVHTLRRLAKRPLSGADKRIVLRFLTSPVELLGDDKVRQLLVVRNHLEHDGQGNLKARPTEEESLLDTGLVLRAIGYRGHPFPGLPFDERRGVIANVDGRVCDNDTLVTGTYVTGWIKRGPKGVIGSNKKCARDTVRNLLEDFAAGRLTPASLDKEELFEVIKARTTELVTLPGWLQIDHLERQRGADKNRPRVKITDRRQLLQVSQQRP